MLFSQPFFCCFFYGTCQRGTEHAILVGLDIFYLLSLSASLPKFEWCIHWLSTKPNFHKDAH